MNIKISKLKQIPPKKKICAQIPTHPFLLSFLLPSRSAVRSSRPHLEERDPI